jgi:hypothetical protein
VRRNAATCGYITGRRWAALLPVPPGRSLGDEESAWDQVEHLLVAKHVAQVARG